MRFFFQKTFLFRFIEFKTRDGFCEDRCGHTCSMRLLASCQRVIIRGCRVSVPRTQSQLHPSASISFPSLHARGSYRQAVASIYLCSFTLLAATSIVHTHSALVHREFCLRVDGVGNPASASRRQRGKCGGMEWVEGRGMLGAVHAHTLALTLYGAGACVIRSTRVLYSSPQSSTPAVWCLASCKAFFDEKACSGVCVVTRTTVSDAWRPLLPLPFSLSNTLLLSGGFFLPTWC